MKKILFLFCLFTINLNAQIVLPTDSGTTKVVYSGVISVDSTNKEALYSRAWEWFAKTYGSSKEVIQMNDKDAGKIIGIALFPFIYKGLVSQQMGNIHYSISVSIKNNKFKYDITDFIFKMDGKSFWGDCEVTNERTNKGFTKGAWEQLKEQTDVEALILVASLKKAMTTQSKSDW